MNEKKLYVLRDDNDGTTTLMLTAEQAALFYYLKDKDLLYDGVELTPVEQDTPINITAEEYHYV